jgi:hypothetical protein
MTEEQYARKLNELDRLLNDPDVPMQPARIWSLLAELSEQDLHPDGMPRTDGGPAGVGLSAGPLTGSAD